MAATPIATRDLEEDDSESPEFSDGEEVIVQKKSVWRLVMAAAFCAGVIVVMLAFVVWEVVEPDYIVDESLGPDRAGRVLGDVPSNVLTVVHFNDLYEISPVKLGSERVGGMAHIAQLIKDVKRTNPDRTLSLFAGDLLSPSMRSSLLKGEEMVDVLNGVGVDAACLGNHEFDYGVDLLSERVRASAFPWLNTNLLNATTDLPIADTQPRIVRDFTYVMPDTTKKLQARVCVFGVEYDVREAMAKEADRVKYLDRIKTSQAEAKLLRSPQYNCTVVIALTHMFAADDCELSAALGKDVDLIVGGHDHETMMQTKCGHAPYIKGDSDLKTAWVSEVRLDEAGRRIGRIRGVLFPLTPKDYADPVVASKAASWEAKVKEQLGEPIGCTANALDGVQKNVRQKETNLGNLFSDSIREDYNSEIAFVHGGGIRGDRYYGPGKLSVADILAMHPFGNTVIPAMIKGKDLKNYLEETLWGYEKLDGRFLQVSGFKYTFSPSAPTGSRLKSITFDNGTSVADDMMIFAGMSDFVYSNSPFMNSALVGLTTLNDAQLLVNSIEKLIRRKAPACIEVETGGRITEA